MAKKDPIPLQTLKIFPETGENKMVSFSGEMFFSWIFCQTGYIG